MTDIANQRIKNISENIKACEAGNSAHVSEYVSLDDIKFMIKLIEDTDKSLSIMQNDSFERFKKNVVDLAACACPKCKERYEKAN